MKYLKKFETESDYQSFLSSGPVVLPSVSLVKDPAYVHYCPMPQLRSSITGDGVAYIRVNYHLNIYDNIEAKFSAGSPEMVLGVRDSNVFGLILKSQESKGYVAFGSSTTTLAPMSTSQTILGVSLGMKKNGDQYTAVWNIGDSSTSLRSYGAGPAEVTANTKLCIFTSSVLDSDTEIDERISKCTIYYVRITDSRTGKLKLDLRPALYNNEVGMFDMVSEVFYSNANSQGAFTLAND